MNAWERPGYSFQINWPPGFVPSPLTKRHGFTPQMAANLNAGRMSMNKHTKEAFERWKERK